MINKSYIKARMRASSKRHRKVLVTLSPLGHNRVGLPLWDGALASKEN